MGIVLPSSCDVAYVVESPSWKIRVDTLIARITACDLIKDICWQLPLKQYSLNQDQQSDVNRFVHGDRKTRF